MGKPWICTYCGAPATSSQGNAYWCSSERCRVRHEWATWEPCIRPRILPPTLFGLAGAAIVSIGFWVLEILTPARWLISWRSGPRRHKMACWVYGTGYWWYERMMGRC